MKTFAALVLPAAAMPAQVIRLKSPGSVRYTRPMLSRAASARCMARLTKISRTLPETSCEQKGDHAAFLVRKKIFAYFLNNHHGDGIVSIACKAFPGENKSLVAAHPVRYYLPAYIGPRGWVALRLDGRKVDWEEAADLLKASYLLTAPRTLGIRVEIAEA